MKTEIIEGNQLIAEFMGLDFREGFKYDEKGNGGKMIVHYPHDKNGNRLLQPEEVLFHSSWGWLMSVVEKIETIEQDNEDDIDGGYSVSIQLKHCYIEDMLGNFICEGFEQEKIESVFQAVCGFIKWFNKNNHLQPAPSAQ